MAEPKPFIFLGTPCYGGMVNIYFLQSVLALQGACQAQGVGLHVELLENDPLITRARARLAARFLAHPQATHFLFVDADIGFAPENALRLLRADKDIVAGVCPLKHIDWAKAAAAAQAGVPPAELMAKSVGYVIRFIPNADSSVEVVDGFARVAFAGTGFQLIKRSVLETVAAAHPELTADLSAIEPGAERATMFFDTMVEPATGQHLSEDYAFCWRWRAQGGEIWADVQSRFTHVGHAAYTGSLMEALRAG